MELFCEEAINISKILAVNMYDTGSGDFTKVKHYCAKLHTYELIFFISGDNATYFNGVVIHDCDNSLRYLPKGCEDIEYRVEKNKDGKCIDIYFDTDSYMPGVACGFCDLPELKNLFIKIYNIWSSKKMGYYVECMEIFYEIIRLIKKHNNGYVSGVQKDKLEAAHEYMLENYKSNDFDYKKMCEKTGLSYSYFKELFISRYKMPPVKYVTWLKVEYARELLITKRYKVAEIAEMCGFDNVYYFSKVFKKQVGVSPKNYKI